MSDEPPRPTELKAREIIESLRSAAIGEVPNSTARDIMTAAFVAEILAVAWSYQFEEDRAIPRTRVRQLVADAIEGNILGASS